MQTDGWMDGRTDEPKDGYDETNSSFYCNFAIVPDNSRARRGTARCKTAGTLRVSAEMKWAKHIDTNRNTEK
jgi:hypothetical protein